MSVVSTASHHESDCQEKPSANLKTAEDLKPPYHNCECGDAGDFVHYFPVKLNDAKFVKEFKAQIISFIQHIWLASHAQKLSPCIITAVRECIKVYKQTVLPVDPVAHFYNYQLEGKSLPAWIILRSPSDKDDPSHASQVGIRHCLLQIFLVELALTKAIRDELYSACATKGFNSFFGLVRRESLRHLQEAPFEGTLLNQSRHSERMEIGHGLLRPPETTLPETLTVVPNT